jgi:hypothetical protein
MISLLDGFPLNPNELAMSVLRSSFPIAVFALIASPVSLAGPLTLTVESTGAARSETFNLGTASSPNGATLTVDRDSLRLEGKPWTPVMGEFHYTRYPASEWREELLKMKAGGIDIVATYVFWIHHEEIEGEWNWAERRNLREFVRSAGEAGLKVVVRCGPWCHGEVRNGGLPDWLLKKTKVRSEDPTFLIEARRLYVEIARQLDHLLWKDGGPVIGIQLDNEYSGPAEYLLALKKIAREVGLDVPVYTRTGWPQLTTPMPFGEILPLYGVYAEGFWDRELRSMPGRYWSGFRFSTLRIDDNIANEQLGRRDAKDAPDVSRYPYLTCEIGGGMMNSYHRRILIDPADIESTMLVKLGSGSTLPGYYMYHGGTNPEGKLTTLMEAQDTPMTNWNDLPVKNYDFQAPLGEFGQIRPQYHTLRRIHLFLQDFGAELAPMPAVMPDVRPGGKDDVATLRWAVRSNGKAGFVFVNNYERGRKLPAKNNVQFQMRLPEGSVVFPGRPVTIAAGAHFFWPFNFALGHGVTLTYATAQPICAVDDEEGRVVFFGATPGVGAEFAIAGEKSPRAIEPGRDVAFQVKGSDGRSVRVVLLVVDDSAALWKLPWSGRDRVFLTKAGLVVDGSKVRLTSTDPAELSVGVFPPMENYGKAEADGIFMRYMPPSPKPIRASATAERVRVAGAPREIPLGKISAPVAAEPTDRDFAAAAVWRIRLPEQIDLKTDPILRIHYVGDVARVTLNGKLISDDFYNGRVFDVGLRRYAPEILKGELQLEILPLRKDAISGEDPKIFMAASAQPDFGATSSMAELNELEIVPRYAVELSVR